MFLTANSLVFEYGIDEEIAKFFVDREPPKDNLYWKDKLLYLRPQMGYVFLPMITDLFYKAGVSKNILLSEDFVQLLEQIGHFSAQQEFDVISDGVALQNCILLVKNKTTDEAFLKALIEHFKGHKNYITSLATPFNALHRGDLFLFSLCILNLNDEQQKLLICIWFALISTILLLDDAEDLEKDKKENEENAFIQSGLNKKGFEQLQLLINTNIQFLQKLNKKMGDALQKKFIEISETPIIKQYSNI